MSDAFRASDLQAVRLEGWSMPKYVRIRQLTFRILTLATGVPHTSFENPATPVSEPPRESIETRNIIFIRDT